MRIKTVIVDDEQPICDEIEYLLKKHPDIEITAIFNNSSKALSYIIENNCPLVFLDIKIPGMSGLELAQELNTLEHPPLIVFITAFTEHALDAFNTPAVGYITKPVTEGQMDHILSKIRNLVPKPLPRPQNIVHKICVIDKGKFIPLDKQDVVFAYVKDKDVYIRTKTKEYKTTLNLQEIESLLSNSSFLRIHRQFIVNLNKIVEIIPWFHGSYLLKMDDSKSEEVPVSRNKAKLLKNAMGLK